MALAASKKSSGMIFPSNPQENVDGVSERLPVTMDLPVRKAVVDTQYTPLSHLVIHTMGDAWTVDYYRQMVGLDDPLQPIQQGTLPAHQQYNKVRNFILKVDTGLEPVQDPQTKEFSVTGEGAIEFGIIPNVGDMFVADIGSGRVGLLTVIYSERLVDTKTATYRVRWQLVTEYDGEWERDLESKVVETTVFEPSMIELHDTPFLTEESHRQLLSLNVYDERIRNQFMDRFWSREVQSILMPQVSKRTYDGFHATFCQHVGLGDVLRPIDVYRYGPIDASDVPTIWDAFIEMAWWPMEDACRKLGSCTVRVFGGTAVYRGVTWSPYECAIYPDGGVPDYSDAPAVPTAGPQYTKYPPQTPSSTLSDELAAKHQLIGRVLFPSLLGTSYVFSAAFYDSDREAMSVLELLAWQMLHEERVPTSLVQELCSKIFKEPAIHQYYFMPLLLVLIHYSRRGD